MFTDLAVIDWIALAFAAVLLAAACAAAVIAYATSSSRPGPLPSILKGRTPAHAAKKVMHEQSGTHTEPRAERGGLPQPSHVPERSHDESSSVDSSAHTAAPTQATAPAADDVVASATDDKVDLDVDQRLAERAARLRGRPVPETRPSPEPKLLDHAEAEMLSHKAMIQSVISNRTPAHAKTFSPSGLESGVASSNFDRTEGFKARTPGFFDDPMGRHELRYWDGHTWTEYVKEHGERFTDPL